MSANRKYPSGDPTGGVGAPTVISLTCLGWPQEAAFRMLPNNLAPEVAKRVATDHGLPVPMVGSSSP